MSNEEPKKIRIIRQLHSRYVDNSCVMKIKLKLLLFIPKEVEYYIYPFRTYLPNLEVTTQDETPLFVLPYEEHLGKDVDIRKLASSTVQGLTEQQLQDMENFAVIILPPVDQDYYEELILSWSESIEQARQISDLFSFSIPIKKEYPPMGESSLYVEMKVSQKHTILEKPIITKPMIERWGIEEIKQREYFGPVEGEEYENVLSDKKDHIVRFPRNFNSKIQISYLIGISNVVKIWLWLGFALGLILCPLLYLNPFMFE